MLCFETLTCEIKSPPPRPGHGAAAPSAALVPGMAVPAPVAAPGVQLGVAGPRPGHARGGGVHPVLHQQQVLVVGYGLTELPEHVVVHVAGFTAAIEERAGVREASGRVVPREQVGAHRQQDGVRVRVRLELGVVREPVVHAERDLEGLGAVLFVLGERARLKDDGEGESTH